MAISKHGHDFVMLENCLNGSFVDGGDDYCRVGGRDLSLIETWNNELGQWNESDNELVKGINAGVYDFPKYDRDATFHSGKGYYVEKEKAQDLLELALFKHFNLTIPDSATSSTSKAKLLFYKAWNHNHDTQRDPKPIEVYFTFMEFVDLIKE